MRDLHRQVLDTGSIPMDVLSAKIGDWIAMRSSAADTMRMLIGARGSAPGQRSGPHR